MAKECKTDRTHCFGSHAAALRCVVPACADWHSRPCVAVLTMRDVHGFSWPAASCIAAIATIAITLGTNGYHESSGPQICSSDWQTIGEPLANHWQTSCVESEASQVTLRRGNIRAGQRKRHLGDLSSRSHGHRGSDL